VSSLSPFPRIATSLIGLLAVVAAVLELTAAGAAATTGSQVALGAYVGSDDPAAVADFESTLGSHVAITSSFRGWGDLFPDAVQQQQAVTGHALLVAWDLGATAATRFKTFTSGAHDDYLTQEAQAASNFGQPFYIRPWAEMNADWVPFQPTPAGDRPAGGTYAEFIAAWRYVVTFFRNHGATNVRWVFNPTTDTYAETTPIGRIWPGADYVDVLGLDGYNWGDGGVLTWRSFANIYQTQYQRLIALAPALPVWVCEFGSKEPSEDDGAPVDPDHTKNAWYRAMLQWLPSAANIAALVMFNVRKERDWRIQSDPKALAAMRSFATTAAPALP
jgi:mannan endo-1,4-beta-mannosidase